MWAKDLANKLDFSRIYPREINKVTIGPKSFRKNILCGFLTLKVLDIVFFSGLGNISYVEYFVTFKYTSLSTKQSFCLHSKGSVPSHVVSIIVWEDYAKIALDKKFTLNRLSQVFNPMKIKILEALLLFQKVI